MFQSKLTHHHHTTQQNTQILVISILFSLSAALLKDLEKVEEWPVDQVLIRFGNAKSNAEVWARDELLKIFKRRGFMPFNTNEPAKDPKVTFVRTTYMLGELPPAV